METVVSATTLARQLGDVLGRIRYRGESFVIHRNGVAVARLVPAEPARKAPTAEALSAWKDAGDPEPDFADALEKIGVADREPDNPWAL
jgi:antitoxin (DNA-binding transcriptional repressor) of toxin-antitoxin stability system